MPRTTPAGKSGRTANETYAARTTSGRLVIARLDTNPESPLHRALRTAPLAPEPEPPQ